MRKILRVVLAILLIMATFITVYAVDETQSFLFDLSANGTNTVEVNQGDVITVTFRLRRADTSDSYTMYAMQNEIAYDNSFFELIEDSVVVKNGVVSTDVTMVDQFNELYMNFLSMSGGTQWDADEIVGSFQLRVLADTGVTSIENTNYLVSTQDGSDKYLSKASDLTVVLTANCTVSFDSNGGTPVADQIVQFGEKLQEPEPPEREGYVFAGWYKDIYLKEKWDFESDTVQGNMRLYAKWEQAEQTVVEAEPQSPAQQIYWWLAILLILAAALIVVLKLRKNRKQK